ncbi:uncharacterized protein N7469_007483 [Penicillium citrinum]|uniref:AAA+ ATPase domain-containing protein n=1 Tax=Penicillium citrinum TaxID=5077 RepID=A0A9W9TLP1_PENCI|nr:uncharacterized protein N7469_007483 [Penicillium citrinum]KAJ5227477.1 hypothetical protein N7469_007483 [Penicillium citrinum]
MPMDTVISNPSVAMGHGQQQALHPFFRQDFGIASQSAPTTPDTSSIPPPNGCSSDAAYTGDQQPDPEYSREETPRTATQVPMSIDSVPLSPEDLNASRRKRRRTDKSKQSEEEPLQTRLAGWLGKDVSTPQAPSLDNSTAPAQEPSESTPCETVPEQTPLIPENIQLQPAQPDRKRKIVKLNLNGRLLSSSPPTQTGDSTQKRAQGNRGRPRKTESSLLILKYGVADGKRLAKIIDDILNSRTTHKPKPVGPPTFIPKEKKPAKPTHPFFLKKSTQEPPLDPKPDDSVSLQPSQSKPAIDQSSRDSADMKREPRNFSSFRSTFRNRTSKFPELVETIWPPRDLVHIRSLDHWQPDQPFAVSSQNDQKKSKLRVVSIHDDEDALLVSTSKAREAAALALKQEESARPTLRIPGRHLASGRTLQTAIDSQMSWASDPRLTRNSLLPVISNLRSSLLSSFSAFDCGKYESKLWAHKYAPRTADDVLQVGREANVLRDWLRHLKITAVDTGKSSKEAARSKSEKKRKKKKQADKLDGFIISSGEEDSEMDNLSGSDDELAGDSTMSAQKTVIRSGDLARTNSPTDRTRLTNAILLSGPPGSGKTASIYAIAKELDFEIFEINAGSRRSARDMLEKVGDMTQNHLVHLLNDDDASVKPRASVPIDETKQNKLMNFFKGKPSQDSNAGSKSTKEPTETSPKPKSDEKSPREQKQSLILLEEADILFEEDKQFWTGVLTLISQSRRPIVITCNDESLLPMQNLTLHAILRYQKPARNVAIDYLLLVAANEGHVLKRDAVSKLFDASGMDLRKSLTELNFWCQIGVGSHKAGLDWILPCWPPEDNVDENGDRMRVLSLNAYESFMGWFNRDLLLGEENSREKDTEALKNTFHWWRLGIQDSEDAAGLGDVEKIPYDDFNARSKLEQLELLDREMDHLEMRSSLDILSSRYISAPPIPESHRSNYIEAYPLLQSSVQPEYTALSEEISISFCALLSNVFRSPSGNTESGYASQMFNGWRQSALRRSVFPSNLTGFQKVFDPIMRYNYTMTLTTGRLAPSFENTLSPITEDLAPYIRSIMVFDVRLKQYRDYLSALSNQQNGHGEKRQRNTRASRAALEGGNKASVRKERWFPDEMSYFLVQATGKPEWQDLLFRMGHFQVQPVVEQCESAERTPETFQDS